MKIKQVFEDHNFFVDWRQGSGFKTEVIPMKYTPFFYQEFFPRSARRSGADFDYAERQVQFLLHHFLRNYEPKDSSQHKLVEAALSFAKVFNAEKILSEIESGEKFIDLKIPLDGAIFRMKRIGDSLGFQIRSGNGNDDIHEAGTDFMKKYCYLPGDSRCWREFIKRIVFTVPLIERGGTNNASRIDLKRTIVDLKDYCCVVEWKNFSDIPQLLINQYTANYTDKVFNGEAGGVKRWLKLVHLKRDKQEAETVAQYRKGNVSKVEGSPGVWEFMDGRGIFLQVGLDCGIRDTFCHDQIPIDINTAERQRILREWAMAMQGQLYAMFISRDFNKNE